MTIATLIVDVLANTAKLQTDVDKINQKMDSVGSAASTVGGLVAKAFTITAVTGFAKEIIDTASEIHDMAKAVGVSGEAIQRYKFAAEQTGATLEDVTRALNFMNKQLAGGDNSTKQALDAAGLSFDQIRAMKPEDAFNAITEAVKLIPDPILQSKVAAELFSKSALALLPGIKEGFKGIGDQAAVMSDETTEAYDRIGDAIVKAKNRGVVWAAELFNSGVNVVKILDSVGAAYDFVTRASTEAARVPPPKMFTMEGARQITLTDRELDNVTKTLDDQKKVLDAAAEKARQHADAIGSLRDQLTGKGAIKAALDMTEALRGVNVVTDLDEKAQKRVNVAMGEAIEAYERFGQTAPPVMNELYIRTLQLPEAVAGITSAIAQLGTQVDLTIPKIAELPPAIAGIDSATAHWLNYTRDAMPEVPKLAKASTVSLGELATAFSNLANIAGGTFSGIAQGFATMISSIGSAQKSMDTFKQGRNDWKEGNTFQGILGMTTGIMGIVSAAITAVHAIANLFDRNKGRDLVIDFAANLGGFDALHNALLAGGDAGEQLWIKLTQGVGRNNPQQAAQVIAEVQAFLDKLGQTTVEPKINVQVNYPDDMPGSSEGPDGAAEGGIAGRGRVIPFKRGGWVPRGTDTVPAMLTPGEIVLNAAQQRRLAGQLTGNDGDLYITLDMGDLGKQMVRVARKDAARGGLRTRAAAGRSY